VNRPAVTLRPVEEGDLASLARFSIEPEALGEFQFAGFTDPRSWRRRWEDNGLLGDDSSTLAVVIPDGSFAGIVGWRPVVSMSGGGVIRRSTSSVEIGIALLPECRGTGYGTAAQAALVDYLLAHTPVHRIQAVTTAGNVAEETALANAGFRREGVLREVGFWAGRWTDAAMYSVVRGGEPST
jgi:RimJ/RimL family protein N-acetyltransferase